MHNIVKEFLLRVDVFPWDGAVAKCYGKVRADLTKTGKNLGPLDLLIAAHALSRNTVLVTNNKAFSYVTNLKTEDRTK